MHLKSITLKGFKSFPDRTRLEFGPGVSVVVGPNGSGKSNITDAVLWAIGEQSPLAVRGQSMQDVIFGRRARRPGAQRGRGRDRARQLRRRASDLPLSEISIMRRLDRTGEGGYRLNGARCRLIDVHRGAVRHGLGKETHSVISQGRVESIVTSKPRDRRLLIEEAAGLGKHRKRRRRAQLKLERTQENLDRALDVEREARTRLRPLKRQAEAAELHERLERQLLEARWAAGRATRCGRGAASSRPPSVRSSRARATARRIEARLERGGRERARPAERALAERSERHDALAGRLYAARAAGDRVALRGRAGAGERAAVGPANRAAARAAGGARARARRAAARPRRAQPPRESARTGTQRALEQAGRSSRGRSPTGCSARTADASRRPGGARSRRSSSRCAAWQRTRDGRRRAGAEQAERGVRDGHRRHARQERMTGVTSERAGAATAGAWQLTWRWASAPSAWAAPWRRSARRSRALPSRAWSASSRRTAPPARRWPGSCAPAPREEAEIQTRLRGAGGARDRGRGRRAAPARPGRPRRSWSWADRRAAGPSIRSARPEQALDEEEDAGAAARVERLDTPARAARAGQPAGRRRSTRGAAPRRGAGGPARGPGDGAARAARADPRHRPPDRRDFRGDIRRRGATTSTSWSATSSPAARAACDWSAKSAVRGPVLGGQPLTDARPADGGRRRRGRRGAARTTAGRSSAHEEELLGVEIEITPAGKSTKRLSLLSGGEKSMTALAFLFAVFLARPCPFYILDEVEAALDDLNLDRFLTLLRRYSDRAQFIVDHPSEAHDGGRRLALRRLDGRRRRSRRSSRVGCPAQAQETRLAEVGADAALISRAARGPRLERSVHRDERRPARRAGRRARARSSRAQRVLPPAAREHGEDPPGARRRDPGDACSARSTSGTGNAGGGADHGRRRREHDRLGRGTLERSRARSRSRAARR